MKRCIACGAPLWETPLLTLDNMPALRSTCQMQNM